MLHLLPTFVKYDIYLCLAVLARIYAQKRSGWADPNPLRTILLLPLLRVHYDLNRVRSFDLDLKRLLDLVQRELVSDQRFGVHLF